MKGKRISSEAENASEEKEQKMPDMRVNLEIPIQYEREEISYVDMRGLLDMTLYDKDRIDREMRHEDPEWDNEVTERYAALVAAHLNHKPWEWLNSMSVRDAIRLRTMVYTFFFVKV